MKLSRPSDSVSGCPNCSLTASKLLCEDSLRGVRRTYFLDGCLGKLVKRVRLSTDWRARCPSSLFSHVSKIIRLRSYPKVFRVAANRIVTFVADKLPDWNSRHMDRVTKSVSVNRPLKTSTSSYGAVPEFVSVSNPRPTFSSFTNYNLAPKSVYDCWGHRTKGFLYAF